MSVPSNRFRSDEELTLDSSYWPWHRSSTRSIQYMSSSLKPCNTDRIRHTCTMAGVIWWRDSLETLSNKQINDISFSFFFFFWFFFQLTWECLLKMQTVTTKIGNGHRSFTWDLQALKCPFRNMYIFHKHFNYGRYIASTCVYKKSHTGPFKLYIVCVTTKH